MTTQILFETVLCLIKRTDVVQTKANNVRKTNNHCCQQGESHTSNFFQKYAHYALKWLVDKKARDSKHAS